MPRRDATLKLALDFSIIGHQRSGSTYFCRLLDSHPDVVCLEEAFNPGFAIEDFTVTDGRTDIAWTWERDAIRRRDADLQGFMDRMRRKTTGKRLGIKLFREHHPAAVAALEASDIPKIVLKRNYLFSYSSWKLAQRTNTWHHLSDTPAPDRSPVDFDLDGFTAWCAETDSFYRRFAGPETLVVWYDELFDRRTFARIADHIGITPDFRTDLVENRRISPVDLAARYAGFERVAELLADSPYEHLLPGRAMGHTG